jgi:hypothetical protein
MAVATFGARGQRPLASGLVSIELMLVAYAARGQGPPSTLPPPATGATP